MKTFLPFSLSNVVFIMLMNAQMPTPANNCWHLNIYEQDKFPTQLSCAWNMFRQDALSGLIWVQTVQKVSVSKFSKVIAMAQLIMLSGYVMCNISLA